MPPSERPRAISADLLHLLADHATDVIYRYRFAPTRGYDYISPSALTLTGYAAEEFYADPEIVNRTVHPDDREKAFNAGTIPQLQRLIRKDGQVRWIEQRMRHEHDATGALVAIEGICRDVTERIAAEEALRRSESNFRELIESWPDSIVVSRDGRIVYANEATAVLQRVPRESLIGRPVVELVSAEQRDQIRARLESNKSGRTRPASANYRLRREDGRDAVLEARTISIVYDGEPAYLTLVLDVTDRTELQARLALSERLASLGTLAAGVAHEINNPLAYASANVDYVFSKLPLDGSVPQTELRAALADARDGIARVAKIVKDIGRLARPPQAVIGPVDVTRAIDRALELANNRLRHRARVRREYAATPPVLAEESRLVQVFLNLFVNAADALPEGQAQSHEVRVSVRRDGSDHVAVEVRDTGMGIAPDALGRVFDPFFTTKAVGEGTGLGLALCHSIVTSLGGDIRVESTPGLGTTFIVCLPIATAATQNAAEPGTATATTSHRGRILVIDDEPSLCAAIARDAGQRHDVVTATSARAGLRRIVAGEQFDVILCDLMMPEMTGVEFFAELARLAPAMQARVVFLTGGAYTDSVRRFLDALTNPLLEKPLDAEALDAIVRARLAANRG